MCSHGQSDIRTFLVDPMLHGAQVDSMETQHVDTLGMEIPDPLTPILAQQRTTGFTDFDTESEDEGDY